MPVAKVLKPFLYAEDHINAAQLAVGDERHFPGDILPGLVAEGFVDDPAKAAAKPAGAAPADPAGETPAEAGAAPEPVSEPAKPARTRKS